MNSPSRLEEMFAHFPGIGPRQARRFVYYILNKPASFAKELARLIEEAKNSTNECSSCHRVFVGKDSKSADRKSALCSICADLNRDQGTLMVVARDSDFESIEKSGAYKGLYFILGGIVPVLDKEPEKRIRLRSLLERIQRSLPTEIILSLNTTPDGEHTADIVRSALSEVSKSLKISSNMRVTVLGRGLSTGAELEYVDGETIKNALKNRQ